VHLAGCVEAWAIQPRETPKHMKIIEVRVPHTTSLKVYHLVNVKTGAIKLNGWGEYYVTHNINSAERMIHAFSGICEYKVMEGNPASKVIGSHEIIYTGEI
jgi:hypothetical protein